MPARDELARRRYEKLVERLESLMRGALRAEYEDWTWSHNTRVSTA